MFPFCTKLLNNLIGAEVGSGAGVVVISVDMHCLGGVTYELSIKFPPA